MNKNKTIAASLLIGLTLSSCGISDTWKGTGIGTALGGLIGAGIGHAAGNAAIGAAIGGVVGGSAGAIIGSRMDKQKEELEKMVEGAKIESINEGQAIKVTFDSGILFATNSSTLSPNSRTALSNFAESIKNNPDTELQILGYTDNTGNDKINIPLSEKRAKSVYDFIVSKGISSSRMKYEGLGSKDPVADNSTAAGRSENRRVEVYILPSAKMIQDAQKAATK